MTVIKNFSFLLIFLLMPISLYAGPNISTQDIDALLAGISQNMQDYVGDKPDQPLVSPQVQQSLEQDFESHYFSPWNKTYNSTTTQSIQSFDNQDINKQLSHPGYGFNLHLVDKTWILSIAANMALDHFPNMKARGILVDADSLRLLPTDAPIFEDPTEAGQGYPFDTLQQSFIPAATPVYIWQVSRDGVWDLIETSQVLGWVHSDKVALVSNSFANSWQAKEFVMANDDNLPLMDNEHIYRINTRIGTLYPYISETRSNYIVGVPAMDINHQAVLVQALLPKSSSGIFPLAMTKNQIALIANKILGEPYGWGGLYGYRDCSATIMDIFAEFGIWLPRSSTEQASSGQYIPFKGLNSEQKQDLIIKNGLPFLSTIDMDGHIMLYLGLHDDKIYTLQTLWGLHTNDDGTEGRAVIGRTVIVPLDFGQGYKNIISTLIDRVNGITLLVPLKSSGS